MSAKILAQIAPAATTLTKAFVPTVEGVVLGQIAITNQGAGAATVRISIAPDGDDTAAAHYLYYDVSIAIAETKILTPDVRLQISDEVRVYSSSGTVSFALLEGTP